MRVVVLHGKVAEDAGKDELDVLVQRDAVSKSLVSLGYDPVAVSFSLDMQGVARDLQSLRPTFVFNLVESVEGRGGLIHLAPALLDHLEISYTGSRTEAILLTSNKLFAKTFLRGAGIPTPGWYTLKDLGGEATQVSGPLIVKSLWEHASIGLDEESVVRPTGPEELRRAMEKRREKLAGECFAEAYIDGREFNLSLLAEGEEPEVLPPAEIRFEGYSGAKPRLVGYRAKWDETSFEYQHTRRSFDFAAEDRALLERLAQLSEECWRLFDLRGYARVDFRVDEEGRPWVLEVNANPCLSPDAGFTAAAERAGLTYSQVIARIVTAMERSDRRT
jgi:D-alanine-D-alanine ligase